MINEVLGETKERMIKAIDSLNNDLKAVRTGRASPSIVDKLTVEYYGMPTPLEQLASISVPDAQTLSIRPYAANDIPAIEKAIALSDIGLAPNNDGQQIRLNIPPLTEDRRRDLTKQVAKRAEEARVAVRNIRRDGIQNLRGFEKDGDVSEDESRRGQDNVQDLTNDFIEQVDKIAKEKEEEIMTI